MTDTNEILTGEQKLSRRRRGFWTYIGLAMVIAFGVGIVGGIASAMAISDVLSPWAVYALWAVIVAGFAWFTRDYFRRIDELDLLDNLWANTFGFYAYFIVAGSWLMFHSLGLAPRPDSLIILIASLAVLTLSYGARKLLQR